MKFLKKLFGNDYNKGIEGTRNSIKRPPKTNLRATLPKVERPPKPPPCPPPRIDPQTRREGRVRKIHRGRTTPTRVFDYPICSTGHVNTSAVPYVYFDEVLKTLNDPVLRKLIGEQLVEASKPKKNRIIIK